MADPSILSCEIDSGHGSACPSKYKCYSISPFADQDDSDSSEQCLCNRSTMFYGEDCMKTHPLAFFTLGAILILVFGSLLYFISVLETSHDVPRWQRRPGSKDSVRACMMFALGLQSLLSLSLLNFRRLYQIGPEFELWFRDYGFSSLSFVSMCFFNLGALFLARATISWVEIVGAMKSHTAALMMRALYFFKVVFTALAVYFLFLCPKPMRVRGGVVINVAAGCFSLGLMFFTSRYLKGLVQPGPLGRDQMMRAPPQLRAAFRVKVFIKMTVRRVFYTLLLAIFYATIDADSSAINPAMVNLSWFCLNLAVCWTLLSVARFLRPEMPGQQRKNPTRRAWWSFGRPVAPKVVPGAVKDDEGPYSQRSSWASAAGMFAGRGRGGGSSGRRFPAYRSSAGPSGGGGGGGAAAAGGPAQNWRRMRPRLPARHIGLGLSSGGTSAYGSSAGPSGGGGGAAASAGGPAEHWRRMRPRLPARHIGLGLSSGGASAAGSGGGGGPSHQWPSSTSGGCSSQL